MADGKTSEQAHADNASKLAQLSNDRMEKLKHALETENVEFPDIERTDGVQSEEGVYTADAHAGLKRELELAAVKEAEALRKARE